MDTFEKLNVATTSTVNLQEQYKKLNTEFQLGMPDLTGDEERADLQASVKEMQEKVAEMLKKDDSEDGADKKEGGVYVWLKVRAYVDEDNHRLDAGFYFIEDMSLYPRLERLPKTQCVIYEDIEDFQVMKIAEYIGIEVEGKKVKELLEKLTHEPKLF